VDHPFVCGQCFLYRLRISVTPFPMWTALPPSEYYEVIRLPRRRRWASRCQAVSTSLPYVSPPRYRFQHRSVSGFPLLCPRSCIPSLNTSRSQERLRSPKFSTLLSLHARPCGPRQTLRSLTRTRPLYRLPVRSNCRRLHSSASRGCARLQGVRSPCRPTEFPVYASYVLFGVGHLLHTCNTRYEWVVVVV
jgi:hypothetical protein